MHWKDLIKYKELIPYMDPLVMELFEVMEELVPINEKFSRLDSFLDWKRRCKEKGLINSNEEMRINPEMIHGCGGM